MLQVWWLFSKAPDQLTALLRLTNQHYPLLYKRRDDVCNTSSNWSDTVTWETRARRAGDSISCRVSLCRHFMTPRRRVHRKWPLVAFVNVRKNDNVYLSPDKIHVCWIDVYRVGTWTEHAGHSRRRNTTFTARRQADCLTGCRSLVGSPRRKQRK